MQDLLSEPDFFDVVFYLALFSSSDKCSQMRQYYLGEINTLHKAEDIMRGLYGNAMTYSLTDTERTEYEAILGRAGKSLSRFERACGCALTQ